MSVAHFKNTHTPHGGEFVVNLNLVHYKWTPVICTSDSLLKGPVCDF